MINIVIFVIFVFFVTFVFFVIFVLHAERFLPSGVFLPIAGQGIIALTGKDYNVCNDYNEYDDYDEYNEYNVLFYIRQFCCYPAVFGFPALSGIRACKHKIPAFRRGRMLRYTPCGGTDAQAVRRELQMPWLIRGS